MKSRAQGFVVSHTHWDRAWYLPFQSYRLRLVRLVDSLLDMLEQDAEFRAFTLDGQTVLLEDYLAIRPEARPRLASLVRQRRLLVGPWYTLPDLFLPSGEAIVRNLQLGRRVSREFGEPMPVGYVPDPFGHCAQMPQVLRGFGLDSFIFMRGLGRLERETLGSIFDWEAPDGSRVLAVYEPDGYLPLGALGHPSPFGRFDGRQPELSLARQRVSEALAALAPLQQEKALLLPNGCDHMPPQPELPKLLAELNQELAGARLIHGTLPEFLAAVRAEGLEHGRMKGDLVGNHDHPVLLSVYSSRIYLKQQNHAAQSLLVRMAEPLCALAGLQAFHPETQSLFDEAWKTLLKNQAHDDICGCSVDAVHDADEVRFAEVSHLAEALATEALESLWKRGFQKPAASAARATDVCVWNPHPFPWRAQVECDVHFADADEWDSPSPQRELSGVDSQGTSVCMNVMAFERKVVRSSFLDTVWGRRYRVRFDVSLPPLGLEVVHLFETASAPLQERPGDEARLENENYIAFVKQGKLHIHEKSTGGSFASALELEYDLDTGDTYSQSPVAGHGPWSATLWHAESVEKGALRLHFELDVPSFARCERLPGEAPKEGPSLRNPNPPPDPTPLKLGPPVSLAITVDVRLGASVEFRIAYENRARDGRLRLLVPVGFATETVLADGHFLVSEKGKAKPFLPKGSPYPGETSYPTFHQGDFVMASSGDEHFWLANRGHPEAELVEREGRAVVAVTLHRAVGMLSVFGGALRRCQAGPSLPTPGAQCQRHLEHHLALGWLKGEGAAARRRAQCFAHPAHALQRPRLPYLSGEGPLPRRMSLLAIDNPNVLLSSCREARRPRTLALRFHNVLPMPQKAEVLLPLFLRAMCRSGLDEEWNPATAEKADGKSLRLELGPHQILTVLVEVI